MLADKALVEASLNSPYSRASFLAACNQHSKDWLFALPIASCGLKLDNKAVRVAVGLRLGLDVCVPHECYCGSRVDSYGVHSFVCKRAPGKTSRHHAFNDLIAHSPVVSLLQVCLSLKSLWVCSDQTASGRMASHLSPGQGLKRYVGTSQ